MHVMEGPYSLIFMMKPAVQELIFMYKEEIRVERQRQRQVENKV